MIQTVYGLILPLFDAICKLKKRLRIKKVDGKNPPTSKNMKTRYNQPLTSNPFLAASRCASCLEVPSPSATNFSPR